MAFIKKNQEIEELEEIGETEVVEEVKPKSNRKLILAGVGAAIVGAVALAIGMSKKKDEAYYFSELDSFQDTSSESTDEVKTEEETK